MTILETIQGERLLPVNRIDILYNQKTILFIISTATFHAFIDFIVFYLMKFHKAEFYWPTGFIFAEVKIYFFHAE